VLKTGATAPLSLLYRGTLESCNYDCGYCPFAKRKDSRARLAKDAAEVARFVSWVGQQERTLRIQFTPWGEALVRRHYREAVRALAAMPHVEQVSVQTNLAVPLSWLERVEPDKVTLWCTYHPGQTSQQRFVERCARLDKMGIRFSVGVVALREHFSAIRDLRAALPTVQYLWLNAYDRRGPGYYTAEDLAWLDGIDPWFVHNRRPPPSRGSQCAAGEEVIAVDGDGEVQRCHFIPERLGNLYHDMLESMLRERPCSRLKCDCYIGYAHRRDLPFGREFGIGTLARIPLRFMAVEA
jgi:MoaA/NifB/PqqE/SkfB family radical SAM enzyme